MSKNFQSRNLWQLGNVLHQLLFMVRLCWRLLLDSRVSLPVKMIPVAAVFYLLSPYDLLPDFMLPVVGQLDDLVVIVLACRLFLSLVPPEIVNEHRRRLSA
ncbi:MAG: DUF1232 domain-containing protein [Deltaproteobacteria bacterium]|nr:DUF1232 domain-containing protein [Candidatus Anaeroferrophillus wilburensis]MBN2889909.1 DUF1232 domain-containing protein [Deltaproteobacteria bacterium]